MSAQPQPGDRVTWNDIGKEAPRPHRSPEGRMTFQIQAALDQQMCPGCGGDVHPSGWADFRAGRVPCDGRLVGDPAPICGYRFPTRWRNKEDRQVIAEQSDGTGVTDKGAVVSAENMRLVRSGVFWTPIAGGAS